MRNNNNIEKIYNTYAKTLYNTSLRIVKDSFKAEEIMQDSIIKYYNEDAATQFNNPGGWLQKVCITKSIDYLRKTKRENIFLTEYAQDNGEDSVNQEPYKNRVSPGTKAKEIKEAIYNLPDKYRIVLSLLLLEGYDYEEVAQITKAPASTIRSWAMRGKKMVIETLKCKE